ncbi:MAG: hypothetical protein LBU51_00885, partial [Bacteroidales bacterium]|nr:hypothetical protein [Bacteroidales bacterium]
MNFFKRLLCYIVFFKGKIVLVFVFNTLYALFSLFSYTMIVPFISVLFGNSEVITVRPEFAFSSEAILNYFNY